MTFRPLLTVIAAAVTVLAQAPALAQTKAEFDALREELRQLREEVKAMRAAQGGAQGAKPADASGWGDRIEQLEIKSKDAVVLGDIGGGFRLPGSETSVRLYGYAEAHAIHDFKQPGPQDNFTDLTFQPTGSGQNGKTKFTAQTSRFGFETSTPSSAGTFNTKLEMDFYSYGSATRNRLRLRHAYGEYSGWLIGQTWSTFMDLDDLPETVDFNGPIGSPFSRRTMIRYSYGDAKAGYKFTAALEDPEDQFGGGSANERMPQVVLRYDQSFDWGAINVRALAHEKRAGDVTKRGYGFGVGGSFKVTDKDLLMGQIAQVEGDVDQMYGSNGYVIDGNGAFTFDKSLGLVVGYAKTFSDQLRGTVALGMNRSRGNATVFTDAAANGGGFPPDNKRLTQWHFNLIYSPFKNIELGGEIVLGERKTFSGETGKMQKLDLMGRYSF